MADNTILNTGVGGDTISTDDIGGGVKVQRNKIQFGTDGSATDVSSSTPLPVDQVDTSSVDYDSGAGTVNQTVVGIALPGSGGPVAGGTSTNPVRVDPTGTTTQPISDAGGSLTVDGTVTVQDGGGSISVDDNGGSLTVDGTVTANLAAGTNNIGDVDVLTAPGQLADGAAGLPAVVQVIGGYDGTNVQAIVTDSTGRPTVNVNGAVPITDNSGSITVDAPVGTPTFVRLSDGSAAITTLPVSLATAPALVTGTASIGKVGLDPQTSGGLSVSRAVSAASTNGTSAKASAGQVYGWFLSNTNAAARYFKVYNKASAPTVGSDTPILTILIPGNTAGAGATVEYTNGIAFGTGIAWALTTGVADADTGAVAASEIVVNLLYK